jgi:uncharacterized damage-inducible protein DinB
MNLIDSIAAEYKRETELTRKALARVPEGKLSWKPHAKSMTLGRLASHIAETQGWTQSILEEDEFNVGPDFKPFDAKTTADILKTFDKHVSNSLASMKKGITMDALMKPWALKRNGQTMFALPKVAVLRSFVLSHQIHHRGQLTVYLRMNDVPVPSIYGPSADEQS